MYSLLKFDPSFLHFTSVQLFSSQVQQMSDAASADTWCVTSCISTQSEVVLEVCNSPGHIGGGRRQLSVLNKGIVSIVEAIMWLYQQKQG